MGKTLWTDEKQSFLEANKTMPVSELAALLNVDISLVRRRIKLIELSTGVQILRDWIPNKVDVLKPKIIHAKGVYSNGITGSRLIANILSDNSSYLQENYTNMASGITVKYSY